MAVAKMLEVFSPEFYQNPYPTLAYLRDNEPVHPVKSSSPMWLVSRYEDTLTGLKDNRFSKKPLGKHSIEDMLPLPKIAFKLLKPFIDATAGPLSNNMLDLDDPDHARLKNLVHKGFTPRLIAKMQTRIETLVDNLLDTAATKGQFDFMADFAFPLPITIIAEILGVPEDKHQDFKTWSQTMIEATSNPNLPKILWDIASLNRYLRTLVQEKRANPQDDLLSALVQVEEAGDMLSENELLGMAAILMIAGHETTVNLLGNGLLALLHHPEQMAMLRHNPSLIKTAVEEFLRYDSPVTMATERYAIEAMTIAGVEIGKGDMVILGLGSANRDAAQFENPDSLDICRENNRHLAFGQGIHYCLGAPLARMEAHYAFNALLERFPNIQLAVSPDKLEWRKSMFIRGMKTMPIKLT